VKPLERAITRIISKIINRARNRGGKWTRRSKMLVTRSGEVRIVIGVEWV
jgi:hypothetical protein